GIELLHGRRWRSVGIHRRIGHPRRAAATTASGHAAGTARTAAARGAAITTVTTAARRGIVAATPDDEKDAQSHSYAHHTKSLSRRQLNPPTPRRKWAARARIASLPRAEAATS